MGGNVTTVSACVFSGMYGLEARKPMMATMPGGCEGNEGVVR